ncbi:MAG: hypothetical protein ACJ8AT_21985 [Hyalangium sp.]|uniref:hypothetical protein n=1 Tax=Hyalangium sp. TaxID=2028555 RepID=UPI00389A4982
MGKIGKIFGKVLQVVQPILTAVNPLLGAAAGFVGGMLQGKNPLQAALGAASGLIPGGAGGLMNNVLGKFAGGALGGIMDGMGGNSLLSGALNAVTGQGKVTDIVGDLIKKTAEKGLTEKGLQNVQELTAHRMAQMVLN